MTLNHPRPPRRAATKRTRHTTAQRAADACAHLLCDDPDQAADIAGAQVDQLLTDPAHKPPGCPAALVYALRHAAAGEAVWVTLHGLTVIVVMGSPGPGVPDVPAEITACEGVDRAVNAISQAWDRGETPTSHFAIPRQVAVLRWEQNGQVVYATGGRQANRPWRGGRALGVAIPIGVVDAARRAASTATVAGLAVCTTTGGYPAVHRAPEPRPPAYVDYAAPETPGLVLPPVRPPLLLALASDAGEKPPREIDTSPATKPSPAAVSPPAASGTPAMTRTPATSPPVTPQPARCTPKPAPTASPSPEPSASPEPTTQPTLTRATEPASDEPTPSPTGS